MKAVIDWNETLSLLRNWQGNACVVVRRTNKQLRINVVRDEQGEQTPSMGPDDWQWTKNGRLRATRSGRYKVLKFLAEFGGDECAPNVREVLAKFSRANVYLYDVIVVDESPDGTVVESHTITRTNLDALLRARHIRANGDVLTAFDDLASRAAGRRRRELPGEEVAAALPKLADCRDSGVDLVQEARRVGRTDPAIRRYLAELPDHRSLDALLWCLQNGGIGLYFKGVDPKDFAAGVEPRLCVSVWRVPPGVPARTTLYLDATADDHVGQLIAPGEIVDVAVALPTELEVIWVPMDFASSQLEDRGSTLTTNQLRSLALRLLFDGRKTLHITHRAFNPGVSAGRLAAKHARLEGAFIHHNGTVARGGNAYKGFDTVVADSYRVPYGAIAQRAAVLEQRADELGYDADASWGSVARHQLETAPFLQALHRLRFNEGSNRVVIMDSRHPTTWGLHISHVIEPAAVDVVMLELLGVVPPAPAGRQLVGDAFRRALHRRRCWLAERRFETALEGASTKGRECLWNSLGKLDHYPTSLPPASVATVSQALRNTLKDDHRNNWESFAREMRLCATRLRTSAPGKDRVLLSVDTPSREEVRAAVDRASVEWDWYETEAHGRFDSAVVGAAVGVRTKVDDLSDAELVGYIASRLAKPLRGVRRRVAALGGPDALRRRWWDRRLDHIKWIRNNIREFAEAVSGFGNSFTNARQGISKGEPTVHATITTKLNDAGRVFAYGDCAGPNSRPQEARAASTIEGGGHD